VYFSNLICVAQYFLAVVYVILLLVLVELKFSKEIIMSKLIK